LRNRAREQIWDGVAPRTRATYEAEWQKFERWCTEKGAAPSSSNELAYLAEVADSKGANAALRAMAGVNKAAAAKGIAMGTCEDFKHWYKAMQRRSSREAEPQQVDALPAEAIMALIAEEKDALEAEWSSETAQTKQMIGGLMLGLRLGVRAINLERIELQHVRTGAQPGMVEVFCKTKTNLAGSWSPVDPIQGEPPACPARLLKELVQWRRRQGARGSDKVFAGVKGGAAGAAFWTRAVRAAAKAGERAGVVGSGKRWSSRSLRAGGLMALTRAGYTEMQARAQGGWVSDVMLHYMRKDQLAQDAASTRLFSVRSP